MIHGYEGKTFFRQLRAETYTQAGASAAQRTREYLYDNQGRSQSVIERSGSLAAPITQRTVYVYDADGNRTQRKEYRGPSESTAAHEVVTWSFDPITGRQTGVTTFTAGPTASTTDDHTTSTTYTHEVLGRLAGSLVSTKVGSADPTLSSVTYRYDAYGNLKEQRTSDGITARRIYGYDHSGESVNTQPFGVGEEEKFHHISAWERDKLVRLDYFRLSPTDYALYVEKTTQSDSTPPISAATTPPGVLLWRQDIDYTPTGQKRTVVEQATAPTGFSTRRVDWAYDELNRLISEQVDSPGTANDYQTRYTLDMVGNRLSEVKIDGGGSSPTTVTTTHGYQPSPTGYLDILTGTSSWKSAAGASQQLVEEVAFGYDLNGSMITRTTTKPDANGAPKQETETFIWDAAGRLTGFIADDLDPQTPADTTPDLTYTYDTQDRRSSRTTETGEGPTATTETTQWTRDESSSTGYDQILAERSDAGTPADTTDDTHAAYLQALTVVAELSLSAAPGSLFTITTYLVDHIGSVRAVATAGNVSFTEYDAYGTVTQGGEGGQPNFGFQGERYEQLTKLADHRARFYDTRTGRWASYDSFEADPANPQYLHKYTFGNVNPVYYTDPSGNVSAGLLLGAAVPAAALGFVGGLLAGSHLFSSITTALSGFYGSYAIRADADRVPKFHKDMALLADDVYSEGTLRRVVAGWSEVFPRTVRLQRSDFQYQGFHARLYQERGSQQYALAFRGTTLTSLHDWDSNLGQGFLGPVARSQYGLATDLAQKVKRSLPPGAKLTMTGHSLGGGLAAAAALATESPSVTFNSAALHWAWALKYSGNSQRPMYNYRVDGEILSGLNDAVGSTYWNGVPGLDVILSPDPQDQFSSSLTKHEMTVVRRALGI